MRVASRIECRNIPGAMRAVRALTRWALAGGLALSAGGCSAEAMNREPPHSVEGVSNANVGVRTGKATTRTETKPPKASRTARRSASSPAEQATRSQAEEPKVRAQGGKPLRVQQGKASYYSDALRGRSTASGELYQPDKFTAAHRHLPFGSLVRVVCKDTQRSVLVTVNDRGPFGNKARIIDLSRAAAEKLGMLRSGVIRVRVEVLELGKTKAATKGKTTRAARRRSSS